MRVESVWASRFPARISRNRKSRQEEQEQAVWDIPRGRRSCGFDRKISQWSLEGEATGRPHRDLAGARGIHVRHRPGGEAVEGGLKNQADISQN